MPAPPRRCAAWRSARGWLAANPAPGGAVGSLLLASPGILADLAGRGFNVGARGFIPEEDESLPTLGWLLALQPAGLLSVVDGLYHPAHAAKSDRQIGVGVGVIAVELDGLLKVAEGLFDPALAVQRGTEIELAKRGLWVDADALSQVVDGVIQPATFFQGHAEVIVESCGIGVEAKGLLEVVDRTIDLALGIQSEGEMVVRQHVLGVEPESVLQGVDRVIRSAQERRISPRPLWAVTESGRSARAARK